MRARVALTWDVKSQKSQVNSLHVLSRIPEGAEHHGGRLHRGQPLALHVAHDHPDPVQRGDHLVQVAADTRLSHCRGVRHRRLQRARCPRHQPQQHPLGHLRDRPHTGQLRLPARPCHRGRDAHAGDTRHHAVTAHFLTPDDGAEIMARHARRHPRTARRLCAFTGLPPDGTNAGFRKAGRTIPFVRLDAGPGSRLP